MSEAHSSHNEMISPYKNKSEGIQGRKRFRTYVAPHFARTNKESRHAKPVNEFTFNAQSHTEKL
jgi:hypothetical protein